MHNLKEVTAREEEEQEEEEIVRTYISVINYNIRMKV